MSQNGLEKTYNSFFLIIPTKLAAYMKEDFMQ